MQKTTFKLRRGPSSEWTADNPVLAQGEPGFETDTGRLKIGNGVSSWSSLFYFLDVQALTSLVQDLTQKEPISLTYAPIITMDVSLSDHFRVTLTADAILGPPINPPRDGMKVLCEIIQDETGGHTITLDSVFKFGTDITSVVLTTTPGKRDLLGIIYDEPESCWRVIALSQGH